MVEIMENSTSGSSPAAGLFGSLLAKVVGIVTLAIAVGGLIWWYRLTPAEQTACWQATKSTAIWFGFMLALPWGLFFLPFWIARKAESNRAGLFLLIGYQAADLLVLLALWGWTVGSAAAWTLLLIGMALAAAYNYVISESLARFAERHA